MNDATSLTQQNSGHQLARAFYDPLYTDVGMSLGK